MSNELPDPWGAELGERGIHSYRDLAGATGVSAETARRLVVGGRTSVGTVNQVADKLFGGDRNKVWRMHGAAVTDHGDWQLPPEASLLDDRQREAIRAVVLAMAPAVRKASEMPAQTPAKEPEGDPTLSESLKRIKQSQQRDVDESPKKRA